ncbi:hypothetical protein HJFPF1_12422 [Paramyrothecium foliicola]|nr:hypothetical protein HJFPF1_12422 [Paramyrothecium foliicola]
MDDDAIYDAAQWENFIPDYGTPRLPSHCDSPATQSQQLNPDLRLPLLQLNNWDGARDYNEKPPTCIHYSLRWRVLVNTGSRSTKLTYQPERVSDLTLAPGAYWDRTLKSTVEERIKRKTPANKRYEPEETNITVSISDRAVDDLLISNEGINIEWEIVEEQLKTWSPLFRCGKKLQIEIIIICKPTSKSSSTKARPNVRRGATGRQHVQIEEEDEEREIAGQASHWNKVYTIMRCQGSREECRGTQCFDDDLTGRHMSVDSEVMQELIAHSEAGNKFEEQKDVPEHIRDMIYKKDRADAQRRGDKKRKRNEPPLTNYPIQFIVPNAFNQAPSGAATALHAQHSAVSQVEPEWSIPEPMDDAIKRYGIWQRARVRCEDWKKGFRLAESITLRECRDLKYVYEKKDITFLTKEGVPTGVAESWVKDIKKWASSLAEYNSQ